MIPYSSTGEVNVALLRGDVDVAVGALSAVAPTLQQKDVKALGVTTAKRSAVLPDVPAIGETVPGYEMETWFAVMAPAGTPPAIVDKLRAAVIGALRDPAVAEVVARDGAEISTSTPQELQALVRADYAKYGALVKSLNIKD
jgi:tripartite-type tricarboxylate transporter receptor subunit TctC